MQLQNISIRNKLVVLVSLMMAGILAAYLIALTLSQRDLIDAHKETLRSVVELAISQIEPSLTDGEEITLEDLQAAKEIIYQLRYRHDDYLFVYNLEGKNLIHPVQPHMEGQYVTNIEDKKGTQIGQIMMGIKDQGELFWTFYWPRPHQTRPVEKLAYARHIPHTDWVIGSGLYLDDLAHTINSRIAIYSLSALLSLLVFFLLARQITRSITQPTEQLAQQIHKLTLGNTDQNTFDTGRQDEFGNIAKSLEQLRQQIMENHALKKANEEAQFLATYDPVTQLLTRKALGDKIRDTLDQLPEERITAILIIKIPLLRDILAQWHSEYYNKVLIDITKRVRTSLLASDTLARHGDDTIALLRPAAKDMQEIIGLISSLQAIIMHPSNIEGEDLSFQSQIGVSIAPQDGSQELQLISHAEEALGEARRQELDYMFFNQLKTFALDERLELWRDIQKALEEDQFYLVFQPLYDLQTNQIISAEVLLRWEHPEQGFISPGRFVTFAEQSGLVSRLDNWVLRAAAQQLHQWQEAGLEIPSLAVNLSGLTFMRTDIQGLIQNATSEFPISLDHLELELTEGVLIESIQTLQDKLESIQKLGISVSIDDFGTGYSSLSRVRNLHINKVKIDRSFIDDLENSSEDQKIIEAITYMAQGLGFKVVAEGVETLGQLNMLRNMNCDIVQGFLLSRPLNRTQFEELLETQNLVIEAD